MPVFQVSTRSTKGMTLTMSLSARPNTWSSHSFDAWSNTPAIAAAVRPSAVSGPQNMREGACIRRSLRGLAHGFPFPERLRVARRDVGILRIGADVVRDLPGARALPAFGEVHDDGHAWHVRQAEGVSRAFAVGERRRRSDADLGQIDAEQRLAQFGIADMNDRIGFERGADALAGPRDLQRAGDDAADQPHLAPFLRELVVAPRGRHGGEQLQMHRGLVGTRPLAPGLFGGEAEHRREPGHGAAE